MTKPIRRKIVKVVARYNPGAHKHWAVGGSRTFMLECGHTAWRKMSAGIPKSMKVRCDTCMQLSLGTQMSIGTIRQTWDAEKQWPVFTEIAK